jgi:hypothetical protein
VKERKCERTIRTCDEGKNKTKGKKGNGNKNINDGDISWHLRSDMSEECIEYIYQNIYRREREEIYENYS